LAALVREAGLSVMIEWKETRERSQDPQSTELNFQSISTRHFERAFTKLRPSVTPEDRIRYELVHKFIRDDGLGAIEALKAASAVLEDRVVAQSRRK
jgi:SpoVK/Ycf46/Vps4 family AAA+-type ATPase